MNTAEIGKVPKIRTILRTILRTIPEKIAESVLDATATGVLMMIVMMPGSSSASAQVGHPTRVGDPAGDPIETVRPGWVVDGVPDSVWMLVEASLEAHGEDRMKDLLDEAEVHARAAVAGHADDVGRRFALAVVLGLRANHESGSTQVNAAVELHQELEAILVLDPEHARARHMLGRLHAGVRRMGGITRWIAMNLLGGAELKKATWASAEDNLSFAEWRAPEVSEHHLQLANLYADTERTDLALQELEHVFGLPARSPLERATWDEALDVKQKLLERLEEGPEKGLGCRVGARRPGHRGADCE